MSEAEVADRLAAMIADLEGFIDRRAADLATPLIEEARAEAAREVAAARHEAERKEDLIAPAQVPLFPLSSVLCGLP